MTSSNKGVVNLIQECSLPLIAGVFAALAMANANPEGYEHLIHWDWITQGKPDEEASRSSATG